MDYELMMNGNVKIGQRAPEFEANTTMGKVSLNDYTRKMVSIIFSSRRFYPSTSYFQTDRTIEK